MALAGLVSACERKPPAPMSPRQAAVQPGGSGATAEIPPEDGNWTMPAKDYASTRYSGLSQITPAR